MDVLNRKPHIWVVGDSTVSGGEDPYYMPRIGWGEALKDYFKDTITIVNLAVAGTSSKSFMQREEYHRLLHELQEGDFLIIGFGHNDEKRGVTTFTSAHENFETPGSFAYTLYNGYIKIGVERGASSILVTPIVRRDETLKYTGASVHVTADGDYPEAIRKLAEDLGTRGINILVSDLTSKTRALSIMVDKDDNPDNDTIYMHGRTGSRELCVDNTHTSLFGAEVNAYLIAEDIRTSDFPLRIYLKEHYENPLEHASMWRSRSVNPRYRDPVYIRPEGGDGFWPDYVDEKQHHYIGSVFGDLTNSLDQKQFTLASRDQKMFISAGNEGTNGKITASSDGIAMYYLRLPVNASFSVSAIVTILSWNKAGGPCDFSAFGLMVRDDMYINKKQSELLGDYVCAGILFDNNHPTGTNTFARRGGKLYFGGGDLERVPSLLEEIPLKLETTGEGYRASLFGNAPVSAGYDIRLTAVDPEYVYVGFFAARSIAIEVSHINIKIK